MTLQLTSPQRAHLQRYVDEYPTRALRNEQGDVLLVLAEAVLASRSDVARDVEAVDAQKRFNDDVNREKLVRLQHAAAQLVGGARNVAPAVIIVDATHLDELRHELIRQNVAVTTVKDAPA